VKAVRKRAEQRLASIDARITELMRIRQGLQQLVEACPGHGDPEHCPILRALADEESQA
jgi:MerR family copper efflux transcriptional regulator